MKKIKLGVGMLLILREPQDGEVQPQDGEVQPQYPIQDGEVQSQYPIMNDMISWGLRPPGQDIFQISPQKPDSHDILRVSLADFGIRIPKQRYECL
ncbi:MAG: hypothetical protein NT018_08690 [Armatimonadetes bacterium]|nr:hypothetical protein [Armatimonadota bacterium]